MLKISFTETPSEKRWILEGRLTQPWIRELRTSWKKNHRNDRRCACIVDLNEVTFIDKSGMRLLRMLAREGVQFTANGIYTKHIIEQLNARRRSDLSNLLGGLFAGFLPILLAVLIGVLGSKAQNTTINGSVPSGSTSHQVVRLALRERQSA